MNVEFKRNVQRQDIWWRGLAMLLYVILYGIAEIVIVAVVLFQFFSSLLFRRTNPHLLKFGRGLSMYVYQIVQFLTFTSDYRPFPLSGWPEGPPAGTGHSARASAE